MKLFFQKELYELAQQCETAVADLRPYARSHQELQKRTQLEYLKLAATLLHRSHEAAGGLSEVLLATKCSNTYYKRLAAIQYTLIQHHGILIARLKHIVDAEQIRCLKHQMTLQLEALAQLRETQDLGFTVTRRKRRSKRQALNGLPHNWRQEIYERSHGGKYSLAILVAALTGCRPAELQHGVIVCREAHPITGKEEIKFCIQGAKVKVGQGQPTRIITYNAEDPHPLVRAICYFSSNYENVPMQEVRIESPVNFTVEVRRLAKALWPKHKKPVTAYCFRHQWSADMKASTDGDSVSLGLGHTSAKTRRVYGTAAQSSADGLRPLSVEATYPIRWAPSHSWLESDFESGETM